MRISVFQIVRVQKLISDYFPSDMTLGVFALKDKYMENELYSYAEYFIVLDDHRLIKSISESVILVIANLRKTILIFILMLLIGARIILNVLLILFLT